ncbi:MAG: GGDEF domain-containing protein [Planctomycetaceae bacterium]
MLLSCGVALALLCAATGGFVAGVLCAPWLQEWAVRRASKQIQRMFELVVTEVERAQKMCAELATAPGSLSPVQWTRFDRLQKEFRESFGKIAKSCGMDAAATGEDPAATGPKTFAITWQKETADALTSLPDLKSFEQNLANMLFQGKECDQESGLLLVKMDKADALRRRLGAPSVEKLLGRLISVVVRSARDQDLVCRVSDDTLALLCPAMAPLAGMKVAEKIRESVRNYHFRVDDNGPEVLVTASFGYANCEPGDSAELVRDRAQDGLARSQSLGRNQLHIHDGQHRALCRS